MCKKRVKTDKDSVTDIFLQIFQINLRLRNIKEFNMRIFFLIFLSVSATSLYGQLNTILSSEVKNDSIRTLQCFSQETSKGNLETRLFLYNDKLYLNWTLDKGGMQAGNLLIQYRNIVEVRGGVKLASITLDSDRLCIKEYRGRFGFLGPIDTAVREAVMKEKKANHLHRVVILTFTSDVDDKSDYTAECTWGATEGITGLYGIKCRKYIDECDRSFRFFAEKRFQVSSAMPDWVEKQRCLMELRKSALENYLAGLRQYYKCRSNSSKYGKMFLWNLGNN